jgi:muramoyltetrapeptide carboxypeptidase
MKLSDLLINKPRRLQKGDTVGVVAPAWTFDIESFKRAIAELRALGFKVKYDNTIFKRHWSMAGYDLERAEEINCMFADRQVRAIFCAKAGYGSVRTIPYLDKKVISRNPKIFVGYSDITILLAYLQKIANMVVFHGPVLSGEFHPEMSRITLDYLFKCLNRPYPVGEMSFPSLKTIRGGKVTGLLVGGNLSLLVSAIGTPWGIDTDGKILFLEDVGEDLENIDELLLHLKFAGKLKKVKGLIFGRMLDCYDSSGRKYNIQDIIEEILDDIEVPIIYGFPSGHFRGRGANVTLPLGTSVTLDADKPSLTINEAAVR